MSIPAPATSGTSDGHVVGPTSLLPTNSVVAACAVGGAAVVLARTPAGTVHAVGQRDPYSRADVMSRGHIERVEVLGQVRDVLISPMYKQAFDLKTGQCTDDPDVNLGVWDVEELEGMIVLRNNRIEPRGVA